MGETATELRGAATTQRNPRRCIRRRDGTDLCEDVTPLGERDAPETSTRFKENQGVIDRARSAGCVLCGTHEDIDFHHVDPGSKSFDIGHGYERSVRTLLAEIEKCVTLCGQCHWDVHNGFLRPEKPIRKDVYDVLRRRIEDWREWEDRP